jgi:hypothetical protein
VNIISPIIEEALSWLIGRATYYSVIESLEGRNGSVMNELVDFTLHIDALLVFTGGDA